MSLATLAEIGIKALKLQECIDARKVVAERFGKACAGWKNKRGIAYIEKHTDQWDEMLAGVSDAHRAILRAKADEANARKRLERACRKAATA